MIKAYGAAFLSLSCFYGVVSCRTEFVGRDRDSGEFDVRCSSNLDPSIGSHPRSLLFFIPQICNANVNKIECNSYCLDILSTKY